jgi:hypothetical protein
MIRRKEYTMPIPPGAEIVERDGRRVAAWRLRNGQLRSAEVVDCQDGALRVRGRSKTYLARYRDARGEMVDVPTGCKDEVAARAVLVQLERRAELVRAGVLTEAEGCAADHAGEPLSKHLDAYERHLRAKGSEPRRISMLGRRLERLFRECRFARLNRLAPGPIERWLVEQAEGGMAAATRNSYREAAVCFANWCRRTHRLVTNPFTDLPRADQKSDRRHHRRALTEGELLRLLNVARLRPLAEFGREIARKPADPKRPRGSRATWTREPLTFETIDEAAERAALALANNPELIARLEQVGRERALMYKTLVLTAAERRVGLAYHRATRSKRPSGLRRSGPGRREEPPRIQHPAEGRLGQRVVVVVRRVA